MGTPHMMFSITKFILILFINLRRHGFSDEQPHVADTLDSTGILRAPETSLCLIRYLRFSGPTKALREQGPCCGVLASRDDDIETTLPAGFGILCCHCLPDQGSVWN